MTDPSGSDRLDWIFSDSGESLEARYDAWAATYDDDHDAWGWRGPTAVAEVALEHVRAAGLVSDDAAIIDAGCGTGKAGVALRSAGWTGRLIGLDLSQGMLDVAATVGAYDELIKCSLTDVPIDADTAIAVVSSGVFTHGHVGGDAFAELCRLTSPAGTIAITQRLDMVDHLAVAVDELTSTGTWQESSRSDPQQFHPDRDESEQLVVAWRVLR